MFYNLLKGKNSVKWTHYICKNKHSKYILGDVVMFTNIYYALKNTIITKRVLHMHYKFVSDLARPDEKYRGKNPRLSKLGTDNPIQK